MMDLFLTNTQLLSSQDVNWWTGVVWITCGLLWWFYHPFTAEDPLVSKWWKWLIQHVRNGRASFPRMLLTSTNCFYQLFWLSFWRHPFTAEDPLVSKWWNATFLQIWWRNKLILILDGLRVKTFLANVYLCVNYLFNKCWSAVYSNVCH